MALEGTLRDFSLADIFQLIGLQRKTGVLTLRSPEDVVTISFADGRVVASDSLNKRLEDRIGQVLLKSKIVTPEELDAALKVQMETLERLGYILLRDQTITRDELRRAVEQQILQIIFRVFRWNDGDYHFSQETSVDYDAELVTPMGAESILMEGARMLDEWPIIEKKIPHRGIIFVPDKPTNSLRVATAKELQELEDMELDGVFEPSKPSPDDHTRITPNERTVLNLLDGVLTVDDVVRNSPFGEFETCKALYTLLTRAIVREASPAELAAALRRATVDQAVAPLTAPSLPWLVILLLPIFVLSQLFAPRNPVNPLLGPGPKLLPRITAAISFSRMWGIWDALQARATLVGSYPENLTELVTEGVLPDRALLDPWSRTYRFVLREQSLLLAGSTSVGVPDPNLLLSRQLGPDLELPVPGESATLVEP